MAGVGGGPRDDGAGRRVPQQLVQLPLEHLGHAAVPEGHLVRLEVVLHGQAGAAVGGEEPRVGAVAQREAGHVEVLHGHQRGQSEKRERERDTKKKSIRGLPEREK